jgi:hypothetical protein
MTMTEDLPDQAIMGEKIDFSVIPPIEELLKNPILADILDLDTNNCCKKIKELSFEDIVVTDTVIQEHVLHALLGWIIFGNWVQ